MRESKGQAKYFFASNLTNMLGRRVMGLMGVFSLLTVLTTTSAHAISLRYKFKVDSSGPRIYACNAGIMGQTANTKVCYKEGTKETCTPTDCSDADKVCHSSCVCTSTNGGDWLMNWGKYDYTSMPPATGSGEGQTFQGTSTTQFATAFTEEDSWGRRVQNLEFQLSSELYTARYFIDVCYNAPDKPFFEDRIVSNFVLSNAQAYGMNSLFKGKVPKENSRDGMTLGAGDYLQKSSLQVQAFVACDFQGVGRYTGQADGALENEASFVLDSTGNPIGAAEGPGSFWRSEPIIMAGQTANLFPNGIGLTPMKTTAPRFCKIRYVFTETDWKNQFANLRSWARHGAEMCTFTEIAEPSPKTLQR